MSAHTCRESADPRHEGYCACGQRLEVIPEPDPRTAPDPEFQRQFLRGAEKLSGLDIGWSDQVADRVAAMEAKYGESYRTIPVGRFLREIEAEAHDIGGWPMFLALRVNALDHLDDEAKLDVKLLLQELAAYGPRVANLVDKVRELVAR